MEARSFRFLWSVALLVSSTGWGGSADAASSGLFEPYVIVTTNSSPQAAAIGDLNGDGRNDVAVVTAFDNQADDFSLLLWLQTPEGALAPAARHFLGGYPKSLAIGDINSDARNDVVVGIGSGGIGVLLQNESGTLEAMLSHATPDSYRVRIADLNNDGRLDVVGVGWATNTVSVLLQDGDGTLASPIVYPAPHGGSEDLEVGDVSGDGLSDVVVMSGQLMLPNLEVLLQQADGTLAPAAAYSVGNHVLTSGVAIGDMTGDGRNDLIVSYGGTSANAYIGGFVQDASGTLRPAGSLPSQASPEPVEIADVNGDGRNDVLVAHGGYITLGSYLQDEFGTLGPELWDLLPSASHYDAHGLAVGDINGDDLPDVAIADGSRLVVLYHVGRPSASLTPASLDFGSLPVGLESDARTATLENTGPVVLTVSSIAVSGDFVETHDCPGVLLPGASCQVQVRFIATAPGLRAGELTVSTNDEDSPHVLALAGTGTNVSLSPLGVVFDPQEVGTASAPRSLVFSNSTTAPVSVSAAVTGNFAAVSECPALLDAWASCAIHVTFAPAKKGIRNGLLTVTTSAGSVAAILGGTGFIAVRFGVSPLRLNFRGQVLGVATSQRGLTVTNRNPTPMTLQAQVVSGDFASTSTCPVAPNTLPAHSSCTIGVSFTPSALGPRTGTLWVTDGRATRIVALSGTGFPGLSIGDASVNEGDAGTTSLTFSLTLTPASTQIVKVRYATEDGSAQQPDDYAAKAGRVTFSPGQTVSSVTVSVNGDTATEGDEWFYVNLSAGINALLTRSQAVGLVVNDEAPSAP